MDTAKELSTSARTDDGLRKWTLGWVGGRRRRKTVYANSEREVLAKRDQVRNQLVRGVNFTDAPRTVEDWMTEWLQTVKTGDGTSASTLERYDQVVRVHIIPVIGRIKLTALTPRDVQLMVSQLRQTAAPASVIKIHGVLRNALGDAERMDLIPRNVARAVRSATLTRTERRALTPREVAKLLAQLARGSPGRCLHPCPLDWTPARRSPWFALARTRIFEAETLFVRQTLQRIDGELRFVPPKTHRSTRSVPLVAVGHVRVDRSASPPSRGSTPRRTRLGGPRPGVRHPSRNAVGAQKCQPPVQYGTVCGGPGLGSSS